MRWISVIALVAFTVPASAETLKVMTVGLGAGTVASNPAGVNCADCDGTFTAGASVVLTATAGAGSTFVGWNDTGCPGTGTCTVTMSTNRSIRPEFRRTAAFTTITTAALDDPALLGNYLTAHLEVDTPARFVAALRRDFRQNWLLMSRSESLQTGTAATPRVLLPSNDARYVFTFALAAHSSYPGAHPDAIEFMQWDGTQKNFRFHEVVLGPIGAMGTFPARTRSVSADDPRCSKCHSTRNVFNRSADSGTEPGFIKYKNKPNWDTYDSWAGLLPFNRDRVYQGSVEAAALRKIFNPWTWRSNARVRSLIEQLELQPTPTPTVDLVERVQGGLDDGHIKFAFDGGAIVASEPAPTGTAQTIAYSFDNAVGTGGSTVQRGGNYVRLHHSDGPGNDEGRAVQLFDLLAGADGSLNQQRIGDELANHRFATGGVPLDARPLGLAITMDCFTRNPATDDVSPMPTAGLSFFNARNGLTINGVYNDTLARARSMPRRKVDMQRFNVDRTDDVYLDSSAPQNGLIQEYGGATSFGTTTTLPRLRQEVFQRPRDLGVDDATNMGGIYVDREDHSSNTGTDYNTERLALYRYFLEPLGASVDKWSISVRGRSRTYTFADVFSNAYFYPSTITSALTTSLNTEPFPGLAAPYTCANLMTAVNSAFTGLPSDTIFPTFTDVQRIFNKSCIECHGGLDYPPFSEFFPATHLDFSEDETPPAGDARLDRSYDTAILFTNTTPASSRLYRRITQNEAAGEAEEICPNGVMPCGGPRLGKADIVTIQRWIEGGRLYTHGDPHINTIDGTNYDFQGAGEFTLLRGPGLEVQARQTPVETEGPLGANAHTGLSSCVSINTAAALKVGRHRITYQPNLNGEPDPSGMQLRVDGKLLGRLDARGFPLSAGGRILPTTAPGGIQIQYPGGTDIVLTPDWWDHYRLWYLNIDVRHARASEGVAGAIAPRNWLPALPDGTFLGARPADLHQRYQDLYERFADAWRVTGATSLFDYAPGKSTANFTVDAWPLEAVQQCRLPRDIEAPPPTVAPLAPLPIAVAQQHCAGVVRADDRANCEQDVMVTGEPGFVKTYLAAERIQLDPIPPAPTLGSPADSATNLGTKVSFTWNKTTDVKGDRLTYLHCVWLADEALTFSKCKDMPTTSVLLEGNNFYWLLLVLIICLVIVIIAIVRARHGRGLLILLAIAILLAIVLVLYFGRKTTMSTTSTALETGKAYYWKVIVDDGQGGTAHSETWRFATKK